MRAPRFRPARAVLLAGALLVLACSSPTLDSEHREPAPSTPPIARPSERVSPRERLAAPSVETPLAEPAARPAIEGLGRLERLYGALDACDRGDPKARAALVLLGDSHTAADLYANDLRTSLQARFGDRGPGWIHPGKVWRTYSPRRVRVASSGGWNVRLALVLARRALGDLAPFGLGGVSALATRAGAFFRLEPLANEAARPAAQTLDIFFRREPRAGAFAVEVDGREVWRLDADASCLESGRERLVLPSNARAITVRALDDRGVELHGVALERDVPGVVVDTIGVNGARATDAALWDWRRLASFELAARHPDLVVFAYGSNEVDDDPFDVGAYRDQLFELVTEARRVSDPPPDCLLVGPPDRMKRGDHGDFQAVDDRLTEIVAAQRATADECGCAFFDTRGAMGGPGAMLRFAEAAPPLAQADRVHLTRNGYRWLADALVGSLLAGYDAWRVRGGGKEPVAPGATGLRLGVRGPSPRQQPASLSVVFSTGCDEVSTPATSGSLANSPPCGAGS